MQIRVEEMQPQQDGIEAPSQTNARLLAYTKNDAEAGTSRVVTGQLTIAQHLVYALFDSGASHSFASYGFAEKLNYAMNRIGQTFRTTLPSGEILLSEFRLEHVPIVIANRELYTNLVVLKIIDYDVILGMDFLGKYQATIDCRNRKVIF